MTKTTQSAGALLAPTKSSSIDLSQPSGTIETTSRIRCLVVSFEHYTEPAPSAPANYTPIGQLTAKWEQDPKRQAELLKARRWSAGALYKDDGDTVRTFRLHKGWSQARLAEEIISSQSHVARIERGTENLAIQTCRKLCDALGIDMNTLNDALRHQESIALAKRR